MFACILLSAGLSQRFGSPKALAPINRNNAIQHLQQTLLASNCDEIVVVLGAQRTTIEPYVLKHKQISLVYNKDHNLGQTSSVQTALKSLSKDVTAVLLLPVDYPFMTSKTINQLIDFFKKQKPSIAIPTYQSRRGHPPIIDRSVFKSILDLPTGIGINSVFAQYPPATLEVEDSGIIKTFNTPEELKKII